jgi:hypothetical protein
MGPVVRRGELVVTPFQNQHLLLHLHRLLLLLLRLRRLHCHARTGVLGTTKWF